MDYPDYVQQYGLDLDFDNFTAITHYADYLDDGNIPEVNECDTVATCSVMLRTRFIKESDIGIMPEDNFIYWDDMEWCYRFHLAGYKVVTIKDSVVLNKMGSNAKPVNTFINYYMWRNRIHFFMKYTPEEKRYKKKTEVFTTAYWCIVTAIYLVWSFQTREWDKTWILWAVAGVLFGGVRAVMRGRIKEK